jgi:hypothetical protein
MCLHTSAPGVCWLNIPSQCRHFHFSNRNRKSPRSLSRRTWTILSAGFAELGVTQSLMAGLPSPRPFTMSKLTFWDWHSQVILLKQLHPQPHLATNGKTLKVFAIIWMWNVP